MPRLRLLSGLLLLALAAALPAQTNVFLDFSGFDDRLNEAFDASGVARPNTAERAQIRTEIDTRLESIYSNYTVDFSSTAPTSGDFERIVFGLTTTNTGLFGLADRIDWRNRFKNDVSRVYTRNFAGSLGTGFDRATNLERITQSLSRTAAHELGHNVGLQHHDCYGYGQCNSGFNHVTNGTQNTFFMGTGQTGASTQNRVSPTGINDLMNVKLQYADGLSPALGRVAGESPAENGSIAGAQPLSFGTLSITGLPSVVIEGGLGTGDVDFYSFGSFAGNLITADILASNVGLAGAGNLDSVLTLYDANGAVLFENDDLAFSGNKFYPASGGGAGLDSIVLNYVAQTTGTYYLGVRGFGNTQGNYNMLVTPVPEPATLAVLGLGALLLRRRKRA